MNIIYPLATPEYELILSNDELYIDSYVNGHLDVETAVPIEKVNFQRAVISLIYQELDKDYIFQFEADNNGIIEDMFFGGENNPGYSSIEVKKGLNRILMRTGSKSVVNQLHIIGIGCNISNLVVTEATDKEFGYFKGIKSVGECEELEVLTHNKRIDNSGNKRADIDMNDGSEPAYTNRFTSTYNHIFLDSDQVYLCTKDGVRISGSSSEYPIYSLTKRYYDKEKNYLGAEYTSNAYYVRFRAMKKGKPVTEDELNKINDEYVASLNIEGVTTSFVVHPVINKVIINFFALFFFFFSVIFWIF